MISVLDNDLVIISGQGFRVEEVTDWGEYGLSYSLAWSAAFNRKGYENRLKWLIGCRHNKTYVLIDRDGKIAAGYSMLKTKAKYKNSLLIAGICNNVFCRPEYQGLNLFVRIGRLALDRLSSKIDIAYGVPNKEALPGHKRVGWRLCNPIKEVLIGDINDMNRNESGSNIEFEKIESLKKDNNNTVFKMASELSIVGVGTSDYIYIYKSEGFYKWRFLERPKTIDREYFVCSYKTAVMFLSFYKPTCNLCILDSQWENVREAEKLIRYVYSQSAKNGARNLKYLENERMKALQESCELGEIKIREERAMIIRDMKTCVKDKGINVDLSFSDNDVY